ncbi:MAG: hypothetical protein H6811_03315 [Phycisphaeraceae bacterium]|nr:hypothetical protein [Phycisphaeraceae bacterium]
MPDEMVTPLRPAWRLRMIVIAAALLGMGLWGLYDATVAYPGRGARVAEFEEWEYLTTLAGGDSQRTIFADRAGVADPAQEMPRLNRLISESNPTLTEVDKQRYDWLRALSMIGRLDAAHTTYSNEAGSDRQPNRRLESLATTWSGKTRPKALSSLDIPSQWAIFVVCAGLGLWVVAFTLRVARRKYRWNSQTRTLTLPGGGSIAPADLDDVDKRRWHKFYVDLKVRQDHPTLGGETIGVDLFRRGLIEGWILEMERERFPERAQEEQEQTPEDSPESGEPAPTEAR